MSSNTVLKLTEIGTARKAGKAIQLSAATQTQVWKITEEAAQKAAVGFKDAVE